MTKTTINILGITGSIGQSAAKIIAAHPDKFAVNVISGHSNTALLSTMQAQLNAKHAICTAREDVIPYLDTPVDITLSAITGFAGLRPLLAAIEHSGAVAIANKEPLVAAGALVKRACDQHDTKILPVDSEHNAIFQVFDEAQRDAITRIILTASGGPFRTWSYDQMRAATPAQAVNHPNWSMGQKISVDSASMMNKALEVIEAHILFDMPAKQIDVLVHPQSIIHSMVEYADGSILSQMGASDMCTPITYALGWPNRIQTPGQTLDLNALTTLNFEPLDNDKFPAINLAKHCINEGLGASIALNAANEIAVAAFLQEKISFTTIIDCVKNALDTQNSSTKSIDNTASLDDIETLDIEVRKNAAIFINNNSR